MTKSELIAKYPLLKVPNNTEYKQRLQWLAEGMLYTHLTSPFVHKINEQEIADYLEFKRARDEKPAKT